MFQECVVKIKKKIKLGARPNKKKFLPKFNYSDINASARYEKPSIALSVTRYVYSSLKKN